MQVLIAITVAIQLPFVAAVAYACERLAVPFAWPIAWLAGAVSVALFLTRVRAGGVDSGRHPLLLRLVDIPYFIHWCACVWCLVPSLASLVVFPIADALRHEPIAWPLPFYFWTYVAGLVVCGYGVLVRRKWFVVRDVEVPVRGLDRAFDGFRIAHLSDLHIGTLTPRSMSDKWMRAANARRPDVAVVTGDMVTSGTKFHAEIAASVAELRAKEGVFVSMGNHDYFGEGEPLVTLLRDRGVTVLRNEGRAIDRDGAKLWLAGIDDTWTRRDDLDRALRDRPDGAKTVLLSHDPERFRQAAEKDVALTLAGHTHGGQIAFPFLTRWISLSHIAHKFHVGLYRIGESVLYVHPGLGTTGPPMRLGVAPAVVILTLRAA